MTQVGGKPQESCLGSVKIAMSIGDVKEGIMKVLKFRGEVWLDLEFGQSSAYRWFSSPGKNEHT